MSQDVLQDIISVIETLPPIPENIANLKSICLDPEASFDDLIPIIEKDPALCADILHIANSAYYGLKHHTESVGMAVRFIGMGPIVNYIEYSFSNRVIRQEFGHIEDIHNYFLHSRQISAAARILASRTGYPAHDLDFLTTAGLLHDIGRLILIYATDEEILASLGQYSWDAVRDITSHEDELLGINHCTAGMKLCQKWQFSERLQTTILQHHTPLKGQIWKESAIIFMSHFLSMKDLPDKIYLTIFHDDARDVLNFSDEKLLAARQEYREIADEIV